MDRPFPTTWNPPTLCYIIAVLTGRMIARREIPNLPPIHDRLGGFGFNHSARAYIKVMRFDG